VPIAAALERDLDLARFANAVPALGRSDCEQERTGLDARACGPAAFLWDRRFACGMVVVVLGVVVLGRLWRRRPSFATGKADEQGKNRN
jgi:hypothetical protein